jgi:NADPH:quinone reductase
MNTRDNARKLLLSAKAAKPEDIQPQIVDATFSEPAPGHAVIQVKAAAVNPSDVKAALGMMPHAVWPRTPGRDYAGTVIAGPREWVGVDVWGTGGDLGVSRDGTHSKYLEVPVEALTKKPPQIPVAAAATVGVPFVTAYEGLRRAGLRGHGQTVIVFGVNGKVGQAATQIATRTGATVVGVERSSNEYAGHASSAVRTFASDDPNLLDRLIEATDGRGADIVYNTVGSPYFAAALGALAIGGTQILISTIERDVTFDILGFYRRNLQMLGVDTLKLTAVECAHILNELLPGFVDGSLKPFEVSDVSLIPLEGAADAYRRVLSGSMDRVVLAP